MFVHMREVFFHFTTMEKYLECVDVHSSPDLFRSKQRNMVVLPCWSPNKPHDPLVCYRFFAWHNVDVCLKMHMVHTSLTDVACRLICIASLWPWKMTVFADVDRTVILTPSIIMNYTTHESAQAISSSKSFPYTTDSEWKRNMVWTSRMEAFPGYSTCWTHSCSCFCLTDL